MFIKRFLNSKREKKAVVTQVLLPLIITLLGLLLAQNSPTQQENPARLMKLSSDLQAGARGNAYFADYRLSPDASFSKVYLLFRTFWVLLNTFLSCVISCYLVPLISAHQTFFSAPERIQNFFELVLSITTLDCRQVLLTYILFCEFF